MTVEQIYGIMNDVTSEILGETALAKEDLSNIVDIGNSIFDAASISSAKAPLTTLALTFVVFSCSRVFPP